ncbi:MAG: carboxypeptidase regulatory-like domain-containing protein [Candidatus Latescibacteria bacterium]|nr:carboxypeptidase regulatory-like domain-containing protein [Candidatus Latescibacterota bacterium]
MSFGKLQVRGEVAPRVYESSQPASAYLEDDQTPEEDFGRFSLEILRQADQDIDLAQFDNDGPDEVPNSGDDDGVVDVVFIVMDRVPTGFLLAEATGISNLGFDDPLATPDAGAKGQVIQIHPTQGTIQQGRFFAEAVGSICHEYGHLLGLPDLYDTEFFRKPGAGPEEDSAGVGAWCLMGWGATGWNGNDGPNSFCAWSRAQLGWAKVEEAAQPQEALRLGDVGKTGDLYKIPLDNREYFLLEYRTKAGSYYDRHLPGEGLLIWHIAALKGIVDLACADGKWRDAGYPLGSEPDLKAGNDNLDFWAHDEPYTQIHQGNLGDVTDPFDGVQFRDFTPQTNPASYSLDGTRSVRIEGIHLEAGQAIAQVRTDSARLEVGAVRLRDPDGNGVLSPGEKATLQFWLANPGGLTLRGVRVVLSTADSLLRIEGPEAQFGVVELVPRARLLPGEEFPQVSLKEDPKSNRQLKMALEVFAGETLLNQHEFNLPIASTFQWSGQVRDEEGKGVEGIKIRISGSSQYSVTTARDGAFQLDLVPGSYSVSAWNATGSFQQSFTLDLAADRYSEWVLDATYPVSGTVRDPQGQPIPNASVYADMAKSVGSYSFRGFGYAPSARDGTYSLQLAKGTYSISVTAKGLPDQSLLDVRVDGPQTLDIDLKKGVRLSVQVADEQGKGQSLSARLYRALYWGSGLMRSSYLQTDIEGRGSAEIIPGAYLATFPMFTLFLPVFTDTAVRVVQQQAVSIIGRVEDETAEPFLNSYLIFTPPAPYNQSWGTIADDGTYRAYLPPSHSQVVFGGGDQGRMLRQSVGEYTAVKDGVFDVQVPRGELVIGRLTDQGGKGRAGVEVQAFSAEARVAYSGRTQEEGVFRLYLQPGTYELTGIEGTSTFFDLGSVDAPFVDTLELQQPAGGRLRGQVVDAQGHPIEQALVVLTRDERILARAFAYYFGVPQFFQSGGLAAAVLSGDKGAYLLHSQPGTYDLIVLPAYGMGVGRLLRSVELAGERTQELVLSTAERVYQVYGQILEEPDTPGGEIVLQFLDPKAGVIAQFSDMGFRGYGAEIPAGHYQVRAGRLGPVGGFQEVYEAGSVSIDRDMRWDIDLAGATTAVAEEEATRPQGFTLSPNYPNPFNPTTTIRFSLPQAGEAELAIYNLLGQRVATLVRGVQEAGSHVLQWNGRDDQGRELASGVYFYRLQAGAQVETRKLLLLR